MSNIVEPLVSIDNVKEEPTSTTLEADKSTSSEENCLPVPKDNKQYKKKEYWDARFEQENAYEWLGGFQEFQDSLLRHLPSDKASKKAVRILVVGCGNSDFSHELVQIGGFPNVTNIDFSPVVIERMQHKYPTETWVVADMLKLDEQFENESFDYVIDKAAMDALVTDEGDPWNPSKSAVASTSTMVEQVQWVLKPDGKFIQISFQQPHFRKRYLHSDAWRSDDTREEVETETVDVGMGYYLFSMVKNS